jgi:polygalacturonase
MTSRRNFINSLMAAGTVALFPRSLSHVIPGSLTAAPGSPAAFSAVSAWAQVPEILRRIKAPVFPKREFPITRFGAVADGTTDSTEAFSKAINACTRAGGGRVLVPAGAFLTGAIHLMSNVDLHLAEGATIKFSRDPKKFLPAVFSRWEGVELMNYSPFIYAFEQKNIAITGAGTLDGQAGVGSWWPWVGRTEYGWKTGDPSARADRQKLFEMAERNVPVAERVFGDGHYLRPQFIQPYRCENVLIEGVTITNSPMWEIHPVLCNNVTVRKVKISSHGPNNDGCDPESCRDVLIEDCVFDTGDDCIAIKSGRNADGRRLHVPSENFIIQGCQMKDGHGGVTIGSEISGGVRNIFAQDCVMSSPKLDRALRIKNNAMRGGLIENIFMRNVNVGEVAEAIVAIDFYYEEGETGAFTPIVRNVEVRNVKSSKSKYALYLRGFKRAPITDIRLEGCTFDGVAQPDLIENVEQLVLHDVRVNGKVRGATGI